MFRSKKDVDRHVQEVFCQLKDENKKNLRCFNIAKLYHQVGDYESAKRYIYRYLEVREEVPGAHKLLAQILEALGQKEAALAQYKLSLELDTKQEDLVLKVCELLADMDISIDVNRARYWADRADRHFPHNPTVFQLKEKILSMDQPTNNGEDLESLITAELAARPTDVQLRVRLLRHYMEKNELEDAYKHVLMIEAAQSHRDSILWYQVLCELFAKCKSNKQSNYNFWILYVSSLERYAALSLKEQGSIVKKTVAEAVQAVYNLDNCLYEAKTQNFENQSAFLENMFLHMWGQLHFHMACLLLRNAKREQGSWNEAGRLCAPLLLTAMHVKPIDLSASWAMHLDDSFKNLIQTWYREGSYRCSQSGHVLRDYGRDNPKRLMNNIDTFCVGTWRERVFLRIFVSRIHQKVKTSYFATHEGPNPPHRLITPAELSRYDEVAEGVWPSSLHHQVWPGVKLRNTTSGTTKCNELQPNQTSHLFPNMQLSVYNINQPAPSTLNRLDIDAFLNTAVLCSTVTMEEQQRNSIFNADRLPTLPADLTNSLCTEDQEKWWAAAYQLSRREGFSDDIGDVRQNLQRGIEVIRCIGNHGLHPNILVHLARIFHHRVKILKEKDKESSEIPALEARCEMYWKAAIPLLERLQNNQTIRSINAKLFDYQGKEMNNVELTRALEEGKLWIAQELVRENQYEQAIETLQLLKCPEASFEQAKIYKILADESVASVTKENLTSEMRSQHSIILSKARNCYYLTLDRLRSPDVDPKHPLNASLSEHIIMIENELKKIDVDVWQGERHRNEEDASSESYSSAHSDDQGIANNTLTLMSNSLIRTPFRNSHHTPKHASTPSRTHISKDILELSRSRTEARPSPERLDAQIRQLSHDSAMSADLFHTLLEQNKVIMQQNKVHVETNKALMLKIEEIKKEIAELRIENKQQRSHQPGTNHNLQEDYPFTEEDYNEYGYANAVGQHSAQIPPNLFQQTARQSYQPSAYPATAALQNYYQGALPFNDPNAQLMQQLLYPTVYPMPSMYLRSQVEQPVPKIPEPALSQPFFQNRLPTQMPEFPMMPTPPQPIIPTMQQQPTVSTTQQPLMSITQQQPFATKEASKNDVHSETSTVIKDAPVNKVPPANVVITTSDKLPTAGPVTQSTLSVTVPPEHRWGSSLNNSDTVPHNYQISMPSQATILTTVNIPSLSTTITTTSPITKTTELQNRLNCSIVSTTSHNSSYGNGQEAEHDPIPDFAPIVPLPAEVPVNTGEEAETTLFCVRAKLFRFCNKEWKERGLGNVKLLKNAEGKVRLLMRREIVLKICANHMLRPDMELTPLAKSDKAWVWVANDFADEEVKLEKLCIRFKTAEDAKAFKEHFDAAKNSQPMSPEKPQAVEKKVEKKKEEKKDEKKDEKTDEKKVEKHAGFSFSSTPIVQTPPKEKTTEVKAETTKPSPFAGFAFNKIQVPQQNPSVFAFGGFGSNQNSPAPAQPAVAATAPVFGQSEGTNVFAGLPATKPLRRPHAPAPGSLATSNNKDTPTKAEPAKTDSISTTKTISTPKNQNAESAPNTAIATLGKGTTNSAPKETKDKAPPAKPAAPKPLSQMNKFKPAAGSWECTGCYTRNNESASVCIACEGPSPASAAINPISKSTSAPTSVKSPVSQTFTPMANSWKCKSCQMSNATSNLYCVTCDSPRDPGMPPKPKVGGFATGGIADTKSTFTFGAQPPKGFSFQMPKNSNEAPVNNSSPAPTFGSKPTFSFNITQPTVPSTPQTAAFGVPGKQFDFQFQKSPEKLDNSDDEVVQGEDVYFAPVIPLPDRIEVKTGEEDEEVLYSHRAKLFRFDPATKEWKERGLGDIKLLQHKESKKLRLIMRRDQVLKLCLNHIVHPNLEISPKDEKTWLWSAADFSDGEIEHVQLACRFKNAEIAGTFKKAVDDALRTQSAEGGESDAKTKSPSKPSADVEIIYELNVEEDEKAAAAKLLLPENFYAYKRKPDCPGCIGCREPEYPLFRPKEASSEKKSNEPPKSAAVNLFSTKPTEDSNKQFNTGTIFGEKKSTNSIFGVQSSQPDNSLSAENLQICSPSTKPNFPSTGNIFGGSGNTFGQSPNAATSLFATTNAAIKAQANTNATTAPNPLFGSAATFGQTFSTPDTIFGDKKGTGIFGDTSAAKLGTSMFGGGQTTINPSFESLANNAPTMIFGNTTIQKVPSTTAETPAMGGFGNRFSNAFVPGSVGTNMFGGGTKANETTDKPTEEKKEPYSFLSKDNTLSFSALAGQAPKDQPSFKIGDKPGLTNNEEKVSFLPTENSISFSTLASQNSNLQGFKKDPNFSFDGTGSSVFGSKSSTGRVIPQKKTPNAANKDKNDDNDQNDDDADDGEEHDPHFEPIVPLPDAIEVRTGEEDEEISFVHRAKLYRYDADTKDWKERGVGEMKLLHHVEHGTYRLLLRREQVHKVVCNMLLTSDMEFFELNSSDRAWMWAGINYVEESPEVEKLAVRFKTPELAKTFKTALDTAQRELQERSTNQADSNYIEDNHEHEYYEEEDEEEEDADVIYYNQDDEDDDEDEDGEVKMFEKRSTVFVQEENEAAMKPLSTGALKVLYDGDIFGARITLEDEDTGELFSNTIICVETVMECNDKECTWAAVDHALNPPARRTLKAVFSSPQIANEMYTKFKEGHECAMTAQITFNCSADQE